MCDGWIQLTQDTVQWRILVNIVMNILFRWKAVHFWPAEKLRVYEWRRCSMKLVLSTKNPLKVAIVSTIETSLVTNTFFRTYHFQHIIFKKNKLYASHNMFSNLIFIEFILFIFRNQTVIHLHIFYNCETWLFYLRKIQGRFRIDSGKSTWRHDGKGEERALGI
jgi:hypothetical protein